MSGANDSEGGRTSEEERSEGGRRNPPAPAKNPYIVLSISYIVKSKTFPVVAGGFEADPNAFRGELLRDEERARE